LIPALGGAERTLAECADGPLVPSWTPDAKWIAYSAGDSESEHTSIWAISIETDERRRLTTFMSDSVATFLHLGDYTPSISPDGSTLAFARAVKSWVSELYTVQLTKDMRPDGEPMKVTDRQYAAVEGITWTSNGREIIYSGNENYGNLLSLWRVSVFGKGTPTRLTFAQPSANYPAIARKVPRLAYTWNVLEQNIWRLDTLTNERKMLTGSTYWNQWPEYSPNGRKIAFCSNRSGEMELWTCDADGTNCVKITSSGVGGSPHWSPDSRWLAYDTYVEGQGEIYVIAADGGAPRNITNSVATEINPSWSQDGEWIYFASDRSERYEIWKGPKDGGEAVPVTHSGGVRVTESPNGDYVYYVKEKATGFFRMPTKGGEEAEVVPNISYFPSIGVTKKGVYFSAPGKPGRIQLFDTATGKVSTVAEKASPMFSVSPDDAYIIWSQEDKSTTDLMLVEGFR